MTTVKTETEYPKTLLKRSEGALMDKVVHNASDEAQARAEGFKTAKEIWG